MARLSRRRSYQVVLDAGAFTLPIGWKHRLVSRRRAERICRFLQRRGVVARVRYFGEIVMPMSPRLFD